MRAHTRTRSMPARAVGVTLVGLVAAVVATLLSGLLAPVHAWDDRSVSISEVRVQVGDEIEVSGGGFPVGEPVDIKICGVPDALGVLSCTPVLEGATVAVNGTVNENIRVEEPAGACPCSVVISTVNAAPTTARLELVGHPMAAQAQAPELIVDEAELVGSNLLGFFGAPAERTLELTFRNAGVAPAAPTLQLSWTKGGGESAAVTDPEVPEIAPGQTQTVRVPVEFEGFSHGEYVVNGHAVVGDLYSSIDASTKVVPWGLYALLLLVLVGAVRFGPRVMGARRNEPAVRPTQRRRSSSTASSSTSSVAPATRSTTRSQASAVSDRELEEAAELAIARATGSAPATTPATANTSNTSNASVAAEANEEILGPPRLAETPIVRRPGYEALGDTPLPVAPPAPLAPPDQPAPPTPSLDAAVYMQAYLETTTPQPGPLGASLEAARRTADQNRTAQTQTAQTPTVQSPAAQSSAAQSPVAPAAEQSPVSTPQDDVDPLSRVWGQKEPIAEARPAPLEEPPATPARGTSIAARLAQAAESVGSPGDVWPPEPRAGGITPAAPERVHGDGAEGAEIVARALETIKEHSGESPLRLPDKDEYVVPQQRDRRAPKGGRRAARTDRPGDRWITRR